MNQRLELSGVIPANILPFHPDYSIDEADYRRHLRWLASVPGVTGITVNGHAAEVSSLSREERRRGVAIACDEIGPGRALIAGIYTDSTFEAVELARDAKAEGAEGLLIFPPSLFMWGVQLRPEMTYRHFATIAEAVDLPLGSNDIVVFERNLRAIRATGRPVAVLSSFTMSLFASFVLGADGAISGMGSVAADLQTDLFACVRRGDLEGARRVNDRLDPLVRVFYAPPFLDMHNRMKEAQALALLGRIRHAVVRPPLQPVDEPERQRIREALAQAGLSVAPAAV